MDDKDEGDSGSENTGSSEDAGSESEGDNHGKQHEEAGWAGLADVARKILQPALKTEVPILARDRTAERQLEAARAEHKVRRQQAVERKRLLEKGHVLPDVSTKNHERTLAKVATRGGVWRTIREHGYASGVAQQGCAHTLQWCGYSIRYASSSGN